MCVCVSKKKWIMNSNYTDQPSHQCHEDRSTTYQSCHHEGVVKPSLDCVSVRDGDDVPLRLEEEDEDRVNGVDEFALKVAWGGRVNAGTRSEVVVVVDDDGAPL